MAIIVGAALFEYGTQTTVITDTGSIAVDAFNSGTTTALVQTDYAPLGDAVLEVEFTSAPAASGAIHLYRRDMNISGTSDSTIPDANFKNTYIGSFPVDLVTTAQYISLTDIPLTIDQEFYLENGTNQATDAAGIDTVLKITPKTYNAKT